MGQEHDIKKQSSELDLSCSIIQPKVRPLIQPLVQSKIRPMIAINNEKMAQAKLEKEKQESSSKMPEEVQAKMENSFGQDFSDVNIHDNSAKAEDMGAKAFAQGKDVHFAPGEFQPNTKQGQELIGHELTHVVQQKEGKVQGGDVNGKDMVNQDPSLEKEADDAGKLASEGKEVQVNGLGSGVQMKEEKDEIDRTGARGDKGLGFQEKSAYYIHVVKAGESLWKIAHNANSDKIAQMGLDKFNKQYLPFRVEEIRVLNNLETDNLEIGQKIKLPARSIAPNKEIDNWSLEKFAPLNTINTAIVSTKTYYDEIKALGFNVLGIREYQDTNKYKEAGDYGPRFLVSGGRTSWGKLFANLTEKRYRALIEPFLEAAVSFSTFTNPAPQEDHQEFTQLGPMKVSVARAPNLPEIMEFLRAMYNVGEKKYERVNMDTKIGEGLFEETPIFRQFIAIYQPLIISALSLDDDQGFLDEDQVSPIANISPETRNAMLHGAISGAFQAIFRYNGNKQHRDDKQADWSRDYVDKAVRNSGYMVKYVLKTGGKIAAKNKGFSDSLFNSFIPFIPGTDKFPEIVKEIKDNVYDPVVEKVFGVDIGLGKTPADKAEAISKSVKEAMGQLSNTAFYKVANELYGENDDVSSFLTAMKNAFSEEATSNI